MVSAAKVAVLWKALEKIKQAEEGMLIAITLCQAHECVLKGTILWSLPEIPGPNFVLNEFYM